MKILTLSLLLVSLSAMAAPSEEIISTTALVDAHSIGCAVSAGQEGHINDRLYTRLGQSRESRTVLHSELLELAHPLAIRQGCDLAKLDTIAKKAEMFFGFIHDAPLQIKKTTSASRRIGNGQCVASYYEDVVVDIGEGIVLKSSAGELRKAEDCE